MAITGLVIGCGNSNSPSEQKQGAPSRNWEKLSMRPFHNAQGVVIVDMPFPSAWKVMSNHKPGEPTIVGPNGIKRIDFPAQNFMSTSDLRMQQIYRQSGPQLRAMSGVEQLVQQDIAPWAAKQGLKFVRQYEIPEVSRIDQWYNEQLYKAVPAQLQISAIGTEWATANGDPYFILMHLVAGNSASLQTWYYFCTGL